MDKLTFYFFLFLAFLDKDVLCKRREHKKEDGGKIVGGTETTVQNYSYQAYLLLYDGRDKRREHKKEDGGKIVGGTETTVQNYSYQAYLLLYDGRDNYQCGGSIVSKHFIVTAAHCLARILTIKVRIASTDASSGGLVYNASSFNSHPLYNVITSDYDVGIIFISQSMTLDGTNARAISMVRSGSDVADGQDVVLTGWGATSEGGPTTSTLNIVTVPAVNRTGCNELLGGRVTTRMFCAGVPEGGKDTCQGDSGGPAVVGGRLASITSYGFGCARPNSPGVYTRIGNWSVRSYIKIMTGV